ncbi:MAG: DNA repair exonuclease [Gemmatimonadetes bacterium]|nr:DNA repair exonuclease [Gemmatimonadota bacterium]MYB60389.1 DNA repair exonuclease [Gemmatimonadota bacterium]
MVRFIHTSDWQIGKVFRFLDDTTMGLLQEARLQAINRIGEQAHNCEVEDVLVAGDIYDMEELTPQSVNRPLERMRTFSNVVWHLIPGNHDPHRPNGLWDRLLHRGLPDNVRVYIKREPVILKDNDLALLPAPLHYRHELDDITAYMDHVELADGVVRIGLAHGTVTDFGSSSGRAPNFITPDRIRSADLDYLALGDWHGQLKINERCWYSGTPEVDAFHTENGGQALLVKIEGRGATPVVEPFPTGYYTWERVTEQINCGEDIDYLETRLRGLAEALDRVLIHLEIEGAVSLEDRQRFQNQITDGVTAAFCYMRIDDDHLYSKPTERDLDQIDRGGFVRAAAEELKQRAEDDSDEEQAIAAQALHRLFIEHMKLQAGQQ